jgi:hypothetical protein
MYHRIEGRGLKMESEVHIHDLLFHLGDGAFNGRYQELKE